MKKALMALLAITLLWSGAITAQQKPSIDLASISTDSAAHRACGILDSSLRSIATLTLRNNGISVEGSSLQMVTIDTIVVTLNNGCAVSLMVKFNAAMTRDEVAGALRGMAFKPRRAVSLNICEQRILLTGPSHDMGQRVGASLEESIKLCLGELTY